MLSVVAAANVFKKRSFYFSLAVVVRVRATATFVTKFCNCGCDDSVDVCGY